MFTPMNYEQLHRFITEIPDLRSHRFIDTDGEISTKLHSDSEVADRIISALAAAGYIVTHDPT